MHRHLLGSFVFYRRHMICIAATGRFDYHVTLCASIGVIRRNMDQPQSAASAPGSLQAKGSQTELGSAIQQRVAAGDFGRRNQGKPVGAVVAAAKVLRILHGSERPLNASEVARAAGLHRGTAYNILRTLQAEDFVGYDEATRSYSVSLHILELAYGVLRRSGLMDLARPLMHTISDAHGVSVYLSKVLGPSSLLLLDWVGVAFRTDLYVTVGRPSPVPAGASGVIMAAFGSSSEPELEALFANVVWYEKPSFADFLARVKEAKKSGFAIDRGAMFQGITLVSVPVLSPTWELLLILTAAGHSHDLNTEALGALSRALQSAAARLSESARLLRLG
jgi:DNA-binding IclR family transcriptional regulator